MGRPEGVELETRRHPLARTVATCYSAVDRFFPACGLYDLTEGIYEGQPGISYEKAQQRQHDYLLDQLQCGPGQRVLDIGCGYGTLLQRVRCRGASGVGITISREQAQHCRREGLDVHQLDYRDLPSDWDRSFDGVVANGSIEHFVHPADVAAGASDSIYSRLFAIVHRLINPRAPARRFVTTTIHLVRGPANPLEALKSPLAFPWNSDAFHWAVLERGWGGYYPEPSQLAHCAEGYFKLCAQQDGTDDYRLTSDEWVRRIRRSLRSPRAFAILGRLIPVMLRAPRQLSALLLAVCWSESWNWQFRPPGPPTRLLRQTWSYRERSVTGG